MLVLSPKSTASVDADPEQLVPHHHPLLAPHTVHLRVPVVPQTPLPADVAEHLQLRPHLQQAIPDPALEEPPDADAVLVLVHDEGVPHALVGQHHHCVLLEDPPGHALHLLAVRAAVQGPPQQGRVVAPDCAILDVVDQLAVGRHLRPLLGGADEADRHALPGLLESVAVPPLGPAGTPHQPEVFCGEGPVDGQECSASTPQILDGDLGAGNQEAQDDVNGVLVHVPSEDLREQPRRHREVSLRHGDQHLLRGEAGEGGKDGLVHLLEVVGGDTLFLEVLPAHETTVLLLVEGQEELSEDPCLLHGESSGRLLMLQLHGLCFLHEHMSKYQSNYNVQFVVCTYIQSHEQHADIPTPCDSCT